jgi:hypothetical protein
MAPGRSARVAADSSAKGRRILEDSEITLWREQVHGLKKRKRLNEKESAF